MLKAEHINMFMNIENGKLVDADTRAEMAR